jgi:hypothetical protein
MNFRFRLCAVSLMAVFAVSCGTAGPGQEPAVSPASPESPVLSGPPGDFSAVTGKIWRLVSVTPALPGRPAFIRSALSDQGFFTLTFSREELRMSGKACPNNYFGPYTVSGESLLFGQVASTLMANIGEPAGLREHEYFGYLRGVYSWRTENGRLVLLAKQEDGTPVTLIFGAD